jgi:hypothetical protein
VSPCFKFSGGGEKALKNLGFSLCKFSLTAQAYRGTGTWPIHLQKKLHTKLADTKMHGIEVGSQRTGRYGDRGPDAQDRKEINS